MKVEFTGIEYVSTNSIDDIKISNRQYKIDEI